MKALETTIDVLWKELQMIEIKKWEELQIKAWIEQNNNEKMSLIDKMNLPEL